jgi:5-methyltetrahydropteroyltriglutamate--homocysteine methyltransferase
MFQTVLVGNQPKIADDRARVNLRVTRNRFDKGKTDQQAVADALEGTIAWTVADQIAAGIDRVTDGRIRWDDPVTPLAAAHEGFEIGGLIRYFDNNVYYRRPQITGPIRFTQSALTNDFRFAVRQSGHPLMAAVCGPFSLAKFCTNLHYKDEDALYADCAALVRAELGALADAGAEWVQLDEPFVGLSPQEIEIATAAISAAVTDCGVKTFVYSYFGSLEKVIDRLWELPVTAIGADCATVPRNFDCLLGGPSHIGRGFGLVDARNTRMETPAFLRERLERLGTFGWPVCWITPSAGLEFLPYQNAQRKMKALTEAVQAVNGNSNHTAAGHAATSQEG